MARSRPRRAGDDYPYFSDRYSFRLGRDVMRAGDPAAVAADTRAFARFGRGNAMRAYVSFLVARGDAESRARLVADGAARASARPQVPPRPTPPPPPPPPQMIVIEEEDGDAATEEMEKQDERKDVGESPLESPSDRRVRRPEAIDVEVYDPRIFVDVDAEDRVYDIVPDDDEFAEELQLQEIIMISTQHTRTNNKDEPSCSRSICKICSNTGCTHSVSIERSQNTDHGDEPTFRVSINGDYDREALLKLTNTLYDALHHRPADGKGKEKLRVGESSTSRPIVIEEEEGEGEGEEEFYCGICMESQPIAELFDIDSCSHIFCAGCVGSYVAAKVEENVISIRCPDPGCRTGLLEPEMCRKIIPRRVFDRWGLALCESAVGAKKFYCPYKECSGLLIDDSSDGNAGEGMITDAECPHCRRMFCAQCRVPWHDGVRCEEFQRLGEDERGREDLMLRRLAADRRWQRCPQCKMFVEKIDGCMFMNCRCGYCFCYSCASPMSKANHYCSKCNR